MFTDTFLNKIDLKLAKKKTKNKVHTTADGFRSS